MLCLSYVDTHSCWAHDCSGLVTPRRHCFCSGPLQLLALTVFLFLLPQWSLSQGMYDIDVTFVTEHCINVSPLYCDQLWVSVLTYIHYTKKLLWWSWTFVIHGFIYHVAFGDLLFSLNFIPQDLPHSSMNPFLILLVNISLYDWLSDILFIDLSFVNIWIVSFLLSWIMMP